MSFLYVNENGSVISIDQGYFVVKYKDGMLKKIPKETLESIVVFGNIQLTTPCIKECLNKGIPVSFFSSKGSYFGRLVSTQHVNIFRQRKQIHLSENKEFTLGLSKKMIKAKIHNQCIVLKRYIKHPTRELEIEIKRIKNSEELIDSCNSIEQLMGYEGNASKNYFSALSRVINPQFAFKGRNKRPPKDSFNSMLSLGYTLLMYEIYGEIENRGINPYAGFLHKDKERHPTLASDLMEEWRAVLIDSMILSLVQGHEISVDNFYKNEETKGILIDKLGMKIFLNKYEKKLRTEARYLDYISSRVSFRRSILLQVGQLAKAIDNENYDIYEPVIIR